MISTGKCDERSMDKHDFPTLRKQLLSFKMQIKKGPIVQRFFIVATCHKHPHTAIN